jgi:branched-chain amino acid transport system substrate-binding protein
VVNGAELALGQVGRRIGKYRIVLRSLDDSTPQSGGWDPAQTTLNAREAIEDRQTVGYIGELNSGASAVSIPLLNRFGIPQISPGSTAVGLTSDAAGASPGEPQKYYPTGVRTFARVMPNDSVQARALVRLQRSMGCTKTFVLDDGEVDGADTATTFAAAAQSAGLPVAGVQSFARGASDYSSLASGVQQTGADCVLITGLTDPSVVLLTKQLVGAMPHATIFGSAELAEGTYADPALGGIPASLDARMLITAPTLDASAYPVSGRAFLASYERRFGVPDPAAIFGYEAMSLMLDAIARASHHGRAAVQRSKVLAAIFATRDRPSVLGTYSIDKGGDTTLRRYGVYRLANGQLTFWTSIEG